MRYDAPWDIVKGHHHLATPELDRWDPELEARAAVLKYFGYAPNWILYPKTSTLRVGPGLHLEWPLLFSSNYLYLSRTALSQRR